MATIDLEELRKEIEADKKSLAEKEAVLRFLEKREGRPSMFSSEVVIGPLPAGVIQLDELIPEARRKTLIDDVQEVVCRFGEQEFTVVHVEAALRKLGTQFKGEKSPRPRISTILGKLEDQGVVVRTFEGKGNVPNRYKLKEYVDDLA